MITQDDLQEEIKTITKYIQYSVEEKDQNLALSFLDENKKDPMILTLLKEFYSNLPAGIEEAVKKVVNVRSGKGAHLVILSTTGHDYLYYVGGEKAVFLCQSSEDMDNSEILNFFGFSNSNDLTQECREMLKRNNSCSIDKPEIAVCPICFAEAGAMHELGCPVEVCPWCDGQLVKCNCRFDKLGVAEIRDEEQLLAFYELLLEKGRIPFKEEHGVSYPSDSRGIPSK